ncbi:MAG TPA: multicopper oxidase domain-containing protein [Ilumatobacteraceae bacterium]|nr:multicopper oxidase domain-containing protein [Ilumatobacteraceae bacterium]
MTRPSNDNTTMHTTTTHHPPLRRRFRLAAAAVLAVSLTTGAIAACNAVTTPTSNVGELDFQNPLAIPPLLEADTDDSGRSVFRLDLQTGTTDFFDDASTRTWGANGSYLGPTLRASRGDIVRVDVHNGLPEPTTMHWHGMHLPAVADGGPHSTIQTGSVWQPKWVIDQPAATLWYHPHPHGATERHVHRGVAGMFILEDDTDPGLPDTYGFDDIPLIVQDVKFTDDRQLDDSHGLFAPIGRLGDHILVNGTRDPHHTVTTERVRLRVLNASTARIYDFGFDDDRTFQLVGTDSGLLRHPHSLDRIQLSPGERAEIIVEFEPGERVVMRSSPPDLRADWWNDRWSGGRDTFDIVEFRAADQLASRPTVPTTIPIDTSDDFSVIGDEPVRRFELAGVSINDQQMDMQRIDFAVEVDATEIWEITNPTGTPHNFHVHDTRFTILDVNGESPPPALSGWKDTVAVLPGDRVRIAVRFTDYTDPTMPYMFHCHLLLHEDRGMMGQFVVIEPGTEPPNRIHETHEHHATDTAPPADDLAS